MSEQLFRFSVLRAAGEPSGTSSIEVGAGHEPLDDSLVPRATAAASWVKANLSDETRIDDLLTGAQLAPGDWPEHQLVGLIALAKREFGRSIVMANERPGVESRRVIASAGDFLTVSALLDQARSLDGATVLREWFAQHPIKVDTGALLGDRWTPRNSLVRAPGICDHFVVRDELVGYEMGEIEDIKNYLKGERMDHTLRYLSVAEEETVVEDETDATRSKETATQQRNSMKSTTQETSNATVGLDARVKTDGQYGPTKVGTDVGFQYLSTTAQSNQTAAEFSSEVLEKSVETVRTRELRRVTRRTRTELEENRDHTVDNTLGAAHTIGIYRWVNSVWKATTYKIGKRLILEFLIPDPGGAIRVLGRAPSAATVPGKPPDLPDLTNLDTAKALQYAAMFGAEGVKAPPLAEQVIGVPFSSTDGKDGAGERITSAVVKDVKIPAGYLGHTVYVTITAMDRADLSVQSNMVIDVPGVRPQFINNDAALPNPRLISGGTGRPNADIRTLVLETTSSFGPGATVPVTIYCEDVRSVAGFVEVHCSATQESIDNWRLDTAQKIAGAHRARMQEWDAKNQARSFEPAPPSVRVDIDALCRHACIAGMLNTWPKDVDRSDAEGWPNARALANADGELIEFMEEAFEWNNLQYVVYPYYWAGGTKKWEDLLRFEHADPHVREFLRAGAARMVVPVRLDLTEAVLFFLATRIPWYGAAAPIPGDPGYIGIAEEIRLAREAKPDGDVVGEYDYRLPTSLTILQQSGELPKQPDQ